MKDKQLKKKLVEDAYEQAKLALNEGNHISAVHKWYGVILNERSQYISSEEQIRSAYEVLDHFEEAVRLNPQDPNTYYLLGAWYTSSLNVNFILPCAFSGIGKSRKSLDGNGKWRNISTGNYLEQPFMML